MSQFDPFIEYQKMVAMRQQQQHYAASLGQALGGVAMPQSQGFVQSGVGAVPTTNTDPAPNPVILLLEDV